jgi:hypothetical protein
MFPAITQRLLTNRRHPMTQPKVRSTTQRFLSFGIALGLLWAQHHLDNPTAKVHHPLHKSPTFQTASKRGYLPLASSKVIQGTAKIAL